MELVYDGGLGAERHVYLDNDSTKHEVTIDGQSEFGTLATNSEKGVDVQCGYSQVQMIGVDVSEPRVKAAVGVFISRTDNGRGNISLPKIYLEWNYKKQGFFADDELAVKVLPNKAIRHYVTLLLREILA